MALPKLYAETSTVRARQVLSDLGAVAWVVLWVRIATSLHDLVQRLADPGRSMEEAGSRIAAWRVPILDRRLGPITSGGEALERAGGAQQDAVHSLALWLAVVVAAVPIVWLLVRHLPRRLSWAREATAASHLRGQPAAAQLFALRALANRPLPKLCRAEPDPAGAYARGDYEALAALELAELGLRTRFADPGPDA